MSRRWPYRVPAAVGAAGVAVVLASACGRGGGQTLNIDAVARYCDLSGQFEAIATSTGVLNASGTYETGDPAAIGKLFSQVEPTVKEMESKAPKDIRADVKTVIDGLRKAQAGDASASSSESFTKADQKIASYRVAHCQTAGAGGGDG